MNKKNRYWDRRIGGSCNWWVKVMRVIKDERSVDDDDWIEVVMVGVIINNAEFSVFTDKISLIQNPGTFQHNKSNNFTASLLLFLPHSSSSFSSSHLSLYTTLLTASSPLIIIIWLSFFFSQTKTRWDSNQPLPSLEMFRVNHHFDASFSSILQIISCK